MAISPFGKSGMGNISMARPKETNRLLAERDIRVEELSRRILERWDDEGQC